MFMPISSHSRTPSKNKHEEYNQTDLFIRKKKDQKRNQRMAICSAHFKKKSSEQLAWFCISLFFWQISHP
jgi:hypothetical protein